MPAGITFDSLEQVKVRILAPFILNDSKKRNKLIMHMHGGGFISGSAACHQKYTRDWSNQTDSLFVSVDYSLAPQNPFPSALNDCWQVYVWLLQNAEQFLGVKPENFVLTGDSAGAHLACTLSILAIQRKVKVPTGLMLSYGLYNFELSSFYPSDLNSIDDPILTLGYAQNCRESLFGANLFDTKLMKNPLVSPVYTSDDILEKMPETVLVVAGLDSLRD